MISIPTLSELYNSIINDLQQQYGATISPTGKVALRAIAAVQAGKLKLYYLAIGSLQKNIFVDTADPESKGGTLERFGRVKLGRNRFRAVAGEYEVIVTGDIGGVIPAGTQFKSDDESTSPGYLFILDDEYTLLSTTDTIELRALTPGTESQLNAGDTLTATAPIANVDSIGTVYAEVVEPLAEETIEAYRQTILDAYRLEPQGGAVADYRLWAADAQGVLRVYPYAKTGYSNEIVIYVEATIADSIDGKGTPSQQLLDDVEDVVEYNPDTTLPILERGRRPLGVFNIDFNVVTIKEIDIFITGYSGITAAQQATLLTAFEAAITALRPFVAAADIIENKNDILDVNKIIAIVMATEPGQFTTASFEVDNVPLSTYTFIDGNIPYLNSITYN